MSNDYFHGETSGEEIKEGAGGCIVMLSLAVIGLLVVCLALWIAACVALTKAGML